MEDGRDPPPARCRLRMFRQMENGDICQLGFPSQSDGETKKRNSRGEDLVTVVSANKPEPASGTEPFMNIDYRGRFRRRAAVPRAGRDNGIVTNRPPQ